MATVTEAELRTERRLGGFDFVLARGAETHPDLIAIDDRLNGRLLTYQELRSRSIKMARALQRLGVVKGDRVAYVFFNEHPSIEVLFACVMLGAIAVPLNTRLLADEACQYVDKQECRVFIARSELSRLAENSAVKHFIVRGDSASSRAALDYEALLAAETDVPLPPQAAWEDRYMLAMTGGTTGGSKAVSWTHGGAMFDVLSVIALLGVKRGYGTICVAPTYHAAGLGWGFLPSFWQGGRVIFSPSTSFSPAFLHKTFAEQPVPFLFLVPAMIDPLHRAWNGKPVSCVKSVCVASAPTPEPLRRKLVEMFPEAEVIAAYGMTESFSVCVQRPDEFLAFPGGVGAPALDSRVRIVDDSGAVVPRGTVGNIVTRTLAMGVGYNGDPASTAVTFRKCGDDPEGLDWIFTGDIGSMDESGRLTIVDRSKDVIITGGENVHSVEIETILASHPGVRECAVVGLPDTQWGELVTAIVVKNGAVATDGDLASELHSLCRARLSGYKVPKRFCFMDELPRSSFGKVLKRDLRGMTYDRAIDSRTLGAGATRPVFRIEKASA